MVEVDELLEKMAKNEILSFKEKGKILRSKMVEKEVFEYLNERFNNLYFEIPGEYVGVHYEGFLLELMLDGKLMGWCWETTESAIMFLNDDDYIERGYLNLGKGDAYYYHSWICFMYDGVEYVLDPCLNFLCIKKDYTEMFDSKVKGKVTCRELKKEFLIQLKDKIESNNLNLDEESVIFKGPEDVNTPFYRNRTSYKIEMEKDNVRKLTAHYYYGIF